MTSMWHNAQIDGRFPLFCYTALLGLLAAIAYFAWRRVRPSALLVAGGVVTLAALAAVIAPRREFLHYVLLLTVPVTLLVGAALGGWWRHLSTARARLVLAGVFLVSGLWPVVTRSLQPVPPIYGGFSYHWRHPRSSAAAVIHALAGAGDTLGIWGWACYLYVETGLPQATRDGNTLWSIMPNARQAYHRAVFLADLKKSAPAVFVDAVGQGAFTFEYRAEQAHECFPELAKYIRENYTLVVDLLDARIYARHGLATLAGLDSKYLWQLVRMARQPVTLGITPPSSSVDRLQTRVIGGRRVVMLLPPARVEWQLDDETREVSLEFGFDPAAYGPGRSNGAELILEVAQGTATRVIFRRYLDPEKQPGDRGPQSARVALPPLAPDSTLVLRTDPGPYGDNAWDWVYLARLRLHRWSDPEPR